MKEARHINKHISTHIDVLACPGPTTIQSHILGISFDMASFNIEQSLQKQPKQQRWFECGFWLPLLTVRSVSRNTDITQRDSDGDNWAVMIVFSYETVDVVTTLADSGQPSTHCSWLRNKIILPGWIRRASAKADRGLEKTNIYLPPLPLFISDDNLPTLSLSPWFPAPSKANCASGFPKTRETKSV